MRIRKAHIKDLPEILDVQKQAFAQEAELYHDFSIQPLVQTIDEIKAEFANLYKTFLIAVENDEIIGGVRAEVTNRICNIQKLAVLPAFQNKGIGTMLMRKVEEMFPDVVKFELFTGEKSLSNIRLYEKLGYRITRKEAYIDHIHKVFMEKINTNNTCQL